MESETLSKETRSGLSLSRRAIWHSRQIRSMPSVSVPVFYVSCIHTDPDITVTCMDARIDPAAAFGIPLGAAHVIRNAGASARDAFRSIVISQQLLGTTEVLVVKHTGCGMLTFDSEVAKGLVKKQKGDAAAKEVEDMDFLTFPDLEAEVKKDVEWLQSKAVEEGIKFSGWVYEVETGKARKIV
jgi:carbonic anhydrase